jgi:hypothetical protein
VLIAAGVAAVCWSAPLADQALHRPGNLVQIARSNTANVQRLGHGGWQAAVNAVGPWPWWLRAPPWERSDSIFVVVARPSRLAIVATAALMLALATLAAVGVRRRRTDATVGALLGLLLTGGVALATTETPERLLFFVLKGIAWAAPASLFVWLVLAWAALQVAPSAWWHRPRTPAVVPTAVVAVAAALAVAHGGSDPRAWASAPSRALMADLEARLDHSGTTLVKLSFRQPFVGLNFHSSVTYGLRRSGYHPVVTRQPFLFDAKLDSWYSPYEHPPDRILELTQGDVAPASRVLARAPLDGAPATVTPRIVLALLRPAR